LDLGPWRSEPLCSKACWPPGTHGRRCAGSWRRLFLADKTHALALAHAHLLRCTRPLAVASPFFSRPAPPAAGVAWLLLALLLLPSSNTASDRRPQPLPLAPARWSLGRLFNFTLLQDLPRSPSSRLWNPVNHSPRDHAPALSPVRYIEHPQLRDLHPPSAQDAARDEYPLLSLAEQQRSRQSLPNSPHFPEPTASRRTSSALPRDRKPIAALDSPLYTPTVELATPTAVTFGSSHPPSRRPAPMAADLAARVAGIQDSAPADMPPPKPATSDLEAAAHSAARASPNRASFPTMRDGSDAAGVDYYNSHHHEDGHDGEAEEEEDETAWGPSHPCFPHINPHVPPTSPLAESTRIIRVKRDWMVAGDLAPTFANLYPEVLDPLLSEDEFRRIVKHVNDVLIKAFSPWSGRSWADALVGLATGWLWDDLGLTGVKSQLDDLETWIENWNRDFGVREGVQIIPLRKSGYLTVCFFSSFTVSVRVSVFFFSPFLLFLSLFVTAVYFF